jgi:hypothetical protein
VHQSQEAMLTGDFSMGEILLSNWETCDFTLLKGNQRLCHEYPPKQHSECLRTCFRVPTSSDNPLPERVFIIHRDIKIIELNSWFHVLSAQSQLQ